jgi:RNA polymerase sigma factor (sigma-70 family)
MINKGIPYFPISANFFEEEVMELVEAKFGILASYIVLRLLCKIYKEGYYISWGKEQNLIFARKIGEGIKEDMIEKIVELLLEKEFFHKETYDQYGVLTSEQIQKVWMEATVRRKIDYSQLPYLLAPKEKNGRQKGGLNKENVDWDGNELLLSDILGTDEDIIYKDLEHEVDKKLLTRAMTILTDREKMIIELRFGINQKEGKEKTQKEVADMLGISQSYISRLEKKIIKRLKREMIKMGCV